jgi:alpha-D-xyloside xylohydrolase
VSPSLPLSLLLTNIISYQNSGTDGFRVRTTYYRPPTNTEPSFLLDPPLEGPENGKAHGLSFDTTSFGINQTVAIRNGNMLFRTRSFKTGQSGLTFYRIEPNGNETLILSEYAPSKFSLSLFVPFMDAE